jgi:hypothetical protein
MEEENSNCRPYEQYHMNHLHIIYSCQCSQVMMLLLKIGLFPYFHACNTSTLHVDSIILLSASITNGRRKFQVQTWLIIPYEYSTYHLQLSMLSGNDDIAENSVISLVACMQYQHFAFWQYISSICNNNQWKKVIPIADLINNTICKINISFTVVNALRLEWYCWN